MMMKWVIQGLKTGVVSTPYPDSKEDNPGITPGLPLLKSSVEIDPDICPQGAFQKGKKFVKEKCIHCGLCAGKVEWDKSFAWAILKNKDAIFPKNFSQSIHIRVVDAGGCGACLNEVKLLNNPYYNMHRLGFFITPTPRKADLLLVIGPVTVQMKDPLLKAYEAMPSPKRVMAVGSCALGCGIFSSNFATLKGVEEVIPVDIEIPGCPPPPLAILHGLLLLAGRVKPGKEEENDVN
jgi:Ni,Fe-hydrogenase III small subunit